MAQPPERTELRELYKHAIDEYRFEVQLGWDRLKHYFLVNAGLTTVAATLLKVGSTPSFGLDAMTAAVFFIGVVSAVLGILAVFRAREYYKVTVFKKTLLEHLLGYDQRIDGQNSELADLAIGTTRGQRRPLEILKWTTADVARPRLSLGSLQWFSCIGLGLAGLIDLVGMGYLIWRSVLRALSC
jgi:hypothetical protein